MGLTVHGRLEGKPKSHLQSSPAEGLTVTKAEADHRGEAGGRAFTKGRIRGFGSCPRCLVYPEYSGPPRRGLRGDIVVLSKTFEKCKRPKMKLRGYLLDFFSNL